MISGTLKGAAVGMFLELPPFPPFPLLLDPPLPFPLLDPPFPFPFPGLFELLELLLPFPGLFELLLPFPGLFELLLPLPFPLLLLPLLLPLLLLPLLLELY